MKTKYILLILTAWITASCSLQEDTEGFSTPGDFYKTKTQCQSAVNSCYIPLKNLYTYKMMIATEGVTDLMYIASGTQDAQLDISPSQPRFGADMWTYGYRGVMYCNMAVTGIENSPIDEKDRNSLVAEAKVLRAFYYYLLIIIISCGNALARQTAATGNPKETAAPAAAIAPAAAGTISTEEEAPATGNAPAAEAPASEAAVPADGQKQLQALKAAEVQSPIRGKKQFLPTRRRIDREINKLKFAYKGEVIMGLTASYGTMSSDDTDIMLILDGIDADGTVATVKPFIGYFYRDNNCLGVRFGYRHMDGNLDAARYDLGESNDASGSIPKVNFNSDNYSFGIFHRSYAGLDPKGRFGLFAEFELSLSTGTSKLSYQPDTASDNMKTTFSDNTQLKLAFNPGAAVYIFPNVCATLSFGLGGIQYTSVTQKDDAGNKIGTRKASNMRFRLNVAAINFGMTVHLWDKKKK